MEDSLSGVWNFSWVHNSEDFSGKKRTAFLSSPFYRFLQQSSFSVEISLIVNGLDEYLSFRIFINDVLREEYSLPIGVFTHKTLENGSVQVVMLQNCDENFQKVSIVRIGPQLNQRSCEHFFLDQDGNIRVNIMATDPRGGVFCVKRIFTRSARCRESVPQKVRKYYKTLGWDALKFWPGMILELCQVRCIRSCRAKLLSLESETIWSVDQSVEAIKRIRFDKTEDPIRIEYWLEVVLGSKAWIVPVSQDCLIALNELVRLQNTIPSTVDSAFKKLSPHCFWKNYVELHRHILQVENIFRTFVLNWSDLAQNAIDSLCSFLEIPQNIDEEQLKFIEMAIEMEGIQESGGQSSDLQRHQSINRMRSFASFRINAKTESLSRYPSASNGFDSSHKQIEAVASEDAGDDGVIMAVTSTDFLGEKTFETSGKQRSLVIEGDERVRSSNELEGASSAMHGAEASLNFHGRRGIQEIAHRSSVHYHGGRGMRGSLNRQEYNTRIMGHSQSYETSDGIYRSLQVHDVPKRLDSELQLYFTEHSGANMLEDIQYDEIYHDDCTGLKYLPVDMVNAPKVKGSIARGLLADKLGNGITVIKLGRQGKSKRKILKCDATVSVLFWFPEHPNESLSERKQMNISDIQDLRLLSDASSVPAGSQTETNSAKPSVPIRGLFQKTSSALSSLFTKAESNSDSALLRGLSAQELSLCFCLVLQDRTIDIQCLNNEDFLLLTVNLKEIIKPQLTPIIRTATDSVDGFEENPLKRILRSKPTKTLLERSESKKSVKFVRNQENNTEKAEKSIRKGESVYDFDEKDLDATSSEDPDSRFIESLRMSSTEALQIGLILTSQERTYGVNMYQSIEQSDMSKIESYVGRGFTMEEAILRLFEKKYVPSHLQTRLGPNQSYESDSDDENEEKQSFPNNLSSLKVKKKSSFLRSLFKDNDDTPSAENAECLNEVSSSKTRSSEALQIGLLLSQQEAAYGTNMYESLQPSDAKEIKELIALGKSVDAAVMLIFQHRYVDTSSNPQSPDSETSSIRNRNLTSNQPGSLTHQSLNVENNGNVDSAFGLVGNPTVPSVASTDYHNGSHTRTGSSFFPNTASVLPTGNPPGRLPPPRSIPRMNSAEAVQMAMMLSEQEEKYGENMFDSLRHTDEPEIERLVSVGYTLEQAVYALFEQKYSINNDNLPTTLAENTPQGLNAETEPGPDDGAISFRVNDAAEDSTYDNVIDLPYAQSSNLAPGDASNDAQLQYSLLLQQQQQMMAASSYPNYPMPYQQGYSPYPNQAQNSQQMYPQYSQQSMYGTQSFYPNQMGYNYSGIAMQPSGYYQNPQQMYYAQVAYAQQQAYAAQFQQQYYQQQLSTQQAQQQYYQQKMSSLSSQQQISTSYQQLQPIASTQYQESSTNHSGSRSNSVSSTGSGGTNRPSALNTTAERPKPVKSTSIFGFMTSSTGKNDRKGCKESDISAITNMGFTREQAINALLAHNQNLLRAVDSLTL